jgi:hypothetical protein
MMPAAQAIEHPRGCDPAPLRRGSVGGAAWRLLVGQFLPEDEMVVTLTPVGEAADG